MNTIMKYITIISAVCLLFIACNDYLDVQQNTKITAETSWSSEATAESNIIGMYHLMRKAFDERFVYWGEYRNGLWEGGRRNGAHEPLSSCYTNRIKSNNSMSNWQTLYTTINQANLIIKNLPNVEYSNEDDKNEALANAYFVRAYCYYWIARVWGDAPLELSATESYEDLKYPSREPAEKVYAQVESDIEKARELMPKTVVSKTTASYAAVEILAADYYLWKYKVLKGSTSDLDKANKANTNVLANEAYILEPVFGDIFEKETSEKEVIFKWPYTMSEYEGGHPYDYLYATTNVTNASLRDREIPVSPDPQWVNITLEYVDFIYSEPSDTRAKTSYGIYENFGWVNKFPGHIITSERVYDHDINAYRLADAILFDAEIKLAQNNFAGAKDALNKIAKRAYGEDEYYEELNTEAEIMVAIVAERKKEFVAEGRLWWDFIRLNVIFDECAWLTGRENEKNVLLWPVHNNSLNSNPNIKQTEGY